MAPRKQISSIPSRNEDVALVQASGHTRLSPRSIGRLRAIGRTFGEVKDKRVSGRISAELLATVKHRLGGASDTEAIEMALANMVVTEDFGTWLIDQADQLDQDFELEL
jgi:hypothetical protein